MSRLASYGRSIDEVRLTQLRQHLNDRYGVELATVDASTFWTLKVARGTAVSDVVVAVSCDDRTGIFQLAAFTNPAWYENRDEPFTRTERDSVERAARWVFQFIPETPTT